MSNLDIESILLDLVLTGLEEGRNGDLAKWFDEYDGDMDWTEFVKKNFNITTEAVQALTQRELQSQIKQLTWIQNICSQLDDDYGELEAFEAIEVHTDKEIKELTSQLNSLQGE